MYNILICDDQPDIVNALKIYLKPEGYQLFAAYTGAEAVEIAKNNDIHLILLDVMMPVMDGITATARIREISNAPIIFLTAKSETEECGEYCEDDDPLECVEAHLTCALCVYVTDSTHNGCHNEKNNGHLDKADKDIAYKLKICCISSDKRTEDNTTDRRDDDLGGE